SANSAPPPVILRISARVSAPRLSSVCVAPSSRASVSRLGSRSTAMIGSQPKMLGPLGCGLQAGAGAVLNVMQPTAGQSVAVYGVGGVGLAGLMAAQIAIGASRRILTTSFEAGMRADPINGPSLFRVRNTRVEEAVEAKIFKVGENPAATAKP